MPPGFDIDGPCADLQGLARASGAPCFQRQVSCEGKAPGGASAEKQNMCVKDRFPNEVPARKFSWARRVHEVEAARRPLAAYRSIPDSTGSEQRQRANSMFSKLCESKTVKKSCSEPDVGLDEPPCLPLCSTQMPSLSGASRRVRREKAAQVLGAEIAGGGVAMPYCKDLSILAGVAASHRRDPLSVLLRRCVTEQVTASDYHKEDSHDGIL